MIETMLTVFTVVMVISVSAVVGYLFGGHREMKRKDKAFKIISAEEPNALLACVKNRYESDLFNRNREN